MQVRIYTRNILDSTVLCCDFLQLVYIICIMEDSRFDRIGSVSFGLLRFSDSLVQFSNVVLLLLLPPSLTTPRYFLLLLVYNSNVETGDPHSSW